MCGNGCIEAEWGREVIPNGLSGKCKIASGRKWINAYQRCVQEIEEMLIGGEYGRE